MRKYWMLLKLQIKAAWLSLPKILAGTALFALLMALAAAGGTWLAKMGGGQEAQMQVAVVLPEQDNEENRYVRMAFEFLGEIETVKSVCRFEPVYGEQETIRALQEGNYTAVVVIPEKFISGIMNGQNTPARIIFEKSGVNTSSSLFREMVRAGAADLSTAQAGIYAVDDVCRMFLGSKNAVAVSEEFLNNQYFSYALDRNIYFEVQDVSAQGSLSTIQFYVSSALVLLFLLCGITCVELLKPDSPVLAAQLKRRGIPHGVNPFFKTAGVTAILFVLFGTVYLILALATIRYPAVGTVIGLSGKNGAVLSVLSGLGGLFVLLFTVFSMAAMIYQITGRTVSGVLLLFILSVVMMFASGCFLPASMLPPAAAQIGGMLPTAWFFKLCGQILTGTVQLGCIGVNLLYLLIFSGVSALTGQRNGG